MIDLNDVFNEIGVVNGNLNANNYLSFFQGVVWDDDSVTNTPYDFFLKTPQGSRRAFFTHYAESERDFYMNVDDPRIFNFDTFYKFAGEYLEGGPSGPLYIISGNRIIWGISDDALRVYEEIDGSPNLILTKATGENINSVAMDSMGDFYVGGVTSDDRSLWKYDINGNLLWDKEHGTQILAVAVDKNNNVITSGPPVSGVRTKKYDSDGNLLWQRTVGTHAVAVDKDDNIYLGGFRVSNNTLWKYDSDGNLLWQKDIGVVISIAIDKNDNIYVAVENTVRKLDNNGDQIWSRDHGAPVQGVAVDLDLNMYICGWRDNENIVARKYDSNGNQLWTMTSDVHLHALAVDKLGGIYFNGRRSTDGPDSGFITLRKCTTEDATFLWGVDHGAGGESVAVPVQYSTLPQWN